MWRGVSQFGEMVAMLVRNGGVLLVELLVNTNSFHNHAGNRKQVVFWPKTIVNGIWEVIVVG